MTTDTILVLGGTGKTGRRVAARLRSRGHTVRIGSRTGQPRFDWQDEHTWAPVLADVTAAYLAYAPDAGLPGAAETIGSFAETAVAHGVQRLVLLTGRGESGALRSEHAVQQAGADWTILRSSFFAQDFSEDEAFADSVRNGTLPFPWGQVAEPFVDLADVADVATAALTEDGHAGRRYELTGPRLLTFADAAHEIAAATGRAVTHLPITAEQFASGLVAQGAPADFAAQLTAMFAEVLDGRNAHVTDGVRQAIGREPRDIGDYILDAAARGAWTPVTSH
ncbi:NAD(P)H-binding protein [Actinocatenispora rupis]|uniref:NmrA family transcriptional regulator n=1 Tax=Actinocatenispora rupis TaxID=519421 RepID=A0A8J3ND92_9ACTN|nr:NAD(P)H-binding protein [Actinocatenispora rupis]GID12680.1 NmrA family transcriptional regulator [Actinocatenispora rupis]